MTERLKVAVVGVGQLGSRHARVFSELDGAELVGVVDSDVERARAVASNHGVLGVAHFRELVKDVRAVSVAVPTVDHEAVTIELLEAGIHVLVEKPIASTRAQAERMTEAAAARDLCLAVGHTERHNPAVEALLSQRKDPRFIEVHRLASFSPRSLDIDVVLDLMIHDLDVVMTLVGREVTSLEAVGVPVLTPRVDIANARLRFEGGAVANITASRVSQEKVRKLRVFERDCYVSLDYQNQKAIRYRILPSEGQRPNIERKELSLVNEEPLKRELQDFLESVAEGRSPRVTGAEGTRALELALRIIKAMNDSRR